jgi:hypothetical protein
MPGSVEYNSSFLKFERIKMKRTAQASLECNSSPPADRGGCSGGDEGKNGEEAEGCNEVNDGGAVVVSLDEFDDVDDITPADANRAMKSLVGGAGGGVGAEVGSMTFGGVGAIAATVT